MTGIACAVCPFGIGLGGGQGDGPRCIHHLRRRVAGPGIGFAGLAGLKIDTGAKAFTRQDDLFLAGGEQRHKGKAGYGGFQQRHGITPGQAKGVVGQRKSALRRIAAKGHNHLAGPVAQAPGGLGIRDKRTQAGNGRVGLAFLDQKIGQLF